MSFENTMKLLKFLVKITKEQSVKWKSNLSSVGVEYYTFLPKSDIKVVIRDLESINPQIFLIDKDGAYKIPCDSNEFCLDFTTSPEKEKAMEKVQAELTSWFLLNFKYNLDEHFRDLLNSI